MKTNNENIKKPCCLLNFISKFNFTKKLWYIAILSAVILVLSSLCYSIFGFNFGFDLKTQYAINVDYTESLSDEKFNDYKSEIKEILCAEGLCSVQFDVTGTYEDINTAIVVRVVNDKNYSSSELDAKLNNVISEIKEKYSTEYSALLISDAFEKQTPNYSNYIINPIIVLSVFLIIAFIYILIRYEIFTALAMLIGGIYNIIMLACLTILFRIPLTAGFTTAFIVSTIIFVIFYIIIADGVREKLVSEDYKNVTNSLMCKDTILNKMPVALVFWISIFAIAIIALITSMFVASTNTFTILLTILGLIIGLFSVFVVANPLWCVMYNRENDKKLQNRILRLNKLEEEKKIPKSKRKPTEEKLEV